jgi:hypothetical protein
VPLVQLGTLPVSAINIGLAASVPGFGAKVTKFGLDLVDVALAGVANVQVSLDLPIDPVSLALSIGAQLTPADIAAELSPGNIAFGGVDAAADLSADIALLTPPIALLGTLVGSFRTGLNTGAIAGWSYSGRSAGFGSRLAPATANGFGKTAPNDDIAAIIIATESFSSWGSFSTGFNTGSSANQEATATDERLVYMGELGGAEWNVSVKEALADLDLFLAGLEGEKAGLEASLQVALGVDVPDPEVILEGSLAVVADLGIDGLVAGAEVTVDFPSVAAEIEAQLDAQIEFIAGLNMQLSAGGLTVWSYTGKASGLGAALRVALQNGLPGANGPNAPAYGLVLVGSPPAMAIFGGIFLTG